MEISFEDINYLENFQYTRDYFEMQQAIAQYNLYSMYLESLQFGTNNSDNEAITGSTYFVEDISNLIDKAKAVGKRISDAFFKVVDWFKSICSRFVNWIKNVVGKNKTNTKEETVTQAKNIINKMDKNTSIKWNTTNNDDGVDMDKVEKYIDKILNSMYDKAIKYNPKGSKASDILINACELINNNIMPQSKMILSSIYYRLEEKTLAGDLYKISDNKEAFYDADILSKIQSQFQFKVSDGIKSNYNTFGKTIDIDKSIKEYLANIKSDLFKWINEIRAFYKDEIQKLEAGFNNDSTNTQSSDNNNSTKNKKSVAMQLYDIHMEANEDLNIPFKVNNLSKKHFYKYPFNFTEAELGKITEEFYNDMQFIANEIYDSDGKLNENEIIGSNSLIAVLHGNMYLEKSAIPSEYIDYISTLGLDLGIKYATRLLDSYLTIVTLRDMQYVESLRQQISSIYAYHNINEGDDGIPLSINYVESTKDFDKIKNDMFANIPELRNQWDSFKDTRDSVWIELNKNPPSRNGSSINIDSEQSLINYITKVGECTSILAKLVNKYKIYCHKYMKLVNIYIQNNY
jgi:hypothetical protein